MPIDYKEYPANWKTEIRPAVLERARNACEACSAPNHQIIYRPEKGKPDWKIAPEGFEGDVMVMDGVKFTKIILTIAHLDHDKLNHDVKLDRLKALCQRCHLLYDIEHHKANRKYGRNHKTNNYKLDF
jgi:hypothetical protein